MKVASEKILTVADLAGTFLFAIEGALAAVRGNLDILGLMVLAFSTALAGGITRDVLMGAIPPQSLKDWRYPAIAFSGAAVVFFLHRFVLRIPPPLLIGMDAAALALFAVAGTQKAIIYKMHPFIAMLLGTITAVGGGVIRDIFLSQVPAVLRTDVYATAALAGSAALLIARRLGCPPTVAALVGGVVCFALRVVAVTLHWNLPKVITS